MQLDAEQLTDLVAAGIKAALTPVLARLAACEARAAVPGPPGRDGKDGSDGRDGKDGLNGRDGKDGLTVVGPTGERGERGLDGKDGAPGRDAELPVEWAERLKALDGRAGTQLTDTEIAAEVSAVLRRELVATMPPPPRMQKRILRDQAGRIAGVVDAPVEAR